MTSYPRGRKDRQSQVEYTYGSTFSVKPKLFCDATGFADEKLNFGIPYKVTTMQRYSGADGLFIVLNEKDGLVVKSTNHEIDKWLRIRLGIYQGLGEDQNRKAKLVNGVYFTSPLINGI